LYRLKQKPQTEPLAPLVVRPRAACRLLAIGTDKLYGLLNSGELPSYLDGGARKIRVSDLNALIERQLAAARGAIHF
jgi:excisionase family DNA binding protein